MNNQPVTPINLKNVSDVADLVKEFKEKYMTKMYIAKEALWDKYNGKFPDKVKSDAYNDLCERCEFLNGLLEGMVVMTGYVAVTTHYIGEFNKGVEKMRIVDKNGEVRGSLLQPQKDFLLQHINRFSKIIETYTG